MRQLSSSQFIVTTGMSHRDLETSTIRVLLATADPVLRETRVALLTQFGFEAAASTSIQNAIDLIQATPFDLLVLGNTLSPEACSQISKAFRQHRPKGRVVEILPASGADCNDSPDATVIGLDGPSALREVLWEQISKVFREN